MDHNFPLPNKAGLVREYLEISREQTPDSNRSTSSEPSRESIPRSSGYLYEPHAAREFASQSRYSVTQAQVVWHKVLLT